jgi:PD-(D/E)XK nuclease superfamily
MPSPLCLKCGKLMTYGPSMDTGYHPVCEPKTNQDLGVEVLEELTDIIRWTDNNSARSQQSTIGPSELGTDCDRRIAYRIAGIPETNSWMDPLPAIVGTAVHGWLERAMTSFQAVHYLDRWETELTVHPDPLVVGHCDLYDKDKQIVLDWKTTSPTKLKEWKRKGPPEHYKAQVNLYARGLIATGRPVSKVALVAIPRSGFLSEVQIWVDDYQPELAQAALDRLYGLAGVLLDQGADLDFEAIPNTPGTGCSYCPWYRGGEKAADLSGCAGNISVSKEKFGKGLVKGS